MKKIILALVLILCLGIWFPNTSNATIVYGARAEFYNGTMSYGDVCWLTDTTFVIVYERAPGGYAVLATVASDKSVSFGATASFESDTANFNSITKMTSSIFVIAFSDYNNVSQGTAIVGSVSGTNISFGSPSVFETGATNYISCARLTDTTFAVAFSDTEDSAYGKARVGTISGTSITGWGNVSTFEAASSNYISITRNADSLFSVAFRGTSNYGRARVGIVDGSNNLTWGNVSTFESSSCDYICITAQTSTRIAISYKSGSTSKATAIVGVIDGSNNLSWGSASAASASADNNYYTSISRTKDDVFIVSYRYTNTNRIVASKAGTINTSTNAISWGAEAEVISTSGYPNSVEIDSRTPQCVTIWGEQNHGYCKVADTGFTLGYAKEINGIANSPEVNGVANPTEVNGI